MLNNDILRRLRYVFDYNDGKVIRIFALGGQDVSPEQLKGWLKKEDDPDFQPCHDKPLAGFLNGLIVEKRGAKEGESAKAESKLSNNLIFMKLKIALNLKAEDVIEILAAVEFVLSKHELSAFFRKVGHKHYRECKDQVLRNFIKGLQLKYRGDAGPTNEFSWDDAKPV